MSSDAIGIKNILDDNRDSLRDGYGVKEIGLFGSFARGDNNDQSDVDLLVEFSRPVGFFKFIELEEYLGKLLVRKVDLVTKDALKSAIREDVLEEIVYV